jgi:two-component system phosphate regulon sensor histidine kinase PhoR
MAAAFGVLMLAAPDALHSPQYSAMKPFVGQLGIGMLVAAALLALGWWHRPAQTATQAAGALPFLAASGAFAATGAWAPMLNFGLTGTFLALEGALARLLDRRAADRAAQPRSVSDYEFSTEAVAWGFTLLVALVGSIDPQPDSRLGIALLAVVVSIFTVGWFHLVPVGDAGPGRNVAATAVYSLFGVVLTELTGGARSPYFFVYFLPIIAVAWTHVPQAIVVPLIIPLAAILTEVGLGLRGGHPGANSAIIPAVPIAVGLLLVSGFTFLLARRNLEMRVRAREAHRQLEAVLTHMGEGLVATDTEGRITVCNPVARTLLNCKTEDGVGEVLTDVLPLSRTDWSPVLVGDHPVRRVLGGTRVSWERYNTSGRGGQRTLAVAATPLLGGGGQHGAIVMLRDARPEMEMEQMRDDFLYMASHELRTPLTVMKGNLEMVLEAALPEALRESLREALASTGRLIRMVNDFLDAARLEHGAVSMRLEDGTLTELVHQAVATLRPDAERKGLQLTYTPVHDLPTVRMDQERTLQILLNLVGNAIRYTTQGGVEITHQVRAGAVETLVRDTGVGVAPEHRDRLFTRFGQLERGLTRTGGSGLGLYISRRLAEQMGGTVLLKESTPGQGSTFALVLPAAAVAPAAARAVAVS